MKCDICGEELIGKGDKEYHEDYTLPGETFVVHEFDTSPTIRIANSNIHGGMGIVPLSQIRKGSVRGLGERGTLTISKWLARRRSWIPKDR